MSETVLKNAFISIGGNDISGYVKSVSLPLSAEMLDRTTMGDDTRQKKAGLKDWSVSVELLADYAAAALDSILFPLLGTEVAVVIRADAGVIGVNNPEFTGQAAFESYPPLGGAVGELAASSISLQAAGDLSRATA